MVETIAALISALIAALALFGWYVEWRARQLRREEVLAWANEAIEALQSVALICALDEARHSEGYLDTKISDLVFKTSALVERGRLFFRNVVIDDFGTEKPSAYRGYRPRILDHLVVSHQIVCAWKQADQITRRKMAMVAEDATRQFVSLVRDEVGRDRTASGGAATHGYGVYLPALVDKIEDSAVRDRNWF